MFDSIIAKVGNEISDLKSIIDWQGAMREGFYNGQIALSSPDGTINVSEIATPDNINWSLFVHCAAVSRLYAILEDGVNEIAARYISILVKLNPIYSSLEENTRVQYRLGVAQILSKWKAQRSLYSHIVEDEITAGLADGLRGKSYELLPDAFLTDSDNYRPDTINRIFGRLGFENIFASISNAEGIVALCADRGTEPAENVLNQLVAYRNEAAHGRVDSILSTRELTNFSDIVELIVRELGVILSSKLLKSGETTGHSKVIGKVEHRYSNNAVGVKTISAHTIQVGDSIFVGKKKLVKLEVKSLRIGASDRESINLSVEPEFGLGLDCGVVVGASIYVWNGIS